MEAPPYAGDPTFERLRRSFQPADLLPELQAAGVHYTIAVEAADDPAENESLLATARHHDWIARVIGWVPLADPDEVTESSTHGRHRPDASWRRDLRCPGLLPPGCHQPVLVVGLVGQQPEMRPMNPPSGFLRRTPTRRFRDRRDAGRVLADELASYRGRDRLLVLGLARGGIPVGWEVASALGAELDVFLVRKLGVPQWRELAMGALASGGGVVMNDDVVSSLRITDQQVRAAIDSETAELQRRELAYRGGRPVVDPRARIVILVDDGIATGASMLAAVRTIRATGPESIVVAVPVGPATACRELAAEADDVVCATMPAAFEAVGQVYNDFHQVTDDEVRELLATPTTGAAT